MESKHLRSGIARAKTIAHYSSPQSASRAELCDLFKKLIVRVEKERDSRRKRIDIETRVDRGLHVGDRIGQRESDLLRGGRTGFADVITGDRYRVPARHLASAI